MMIMMFAMINMKVMLVIFVDNDDKNDQNKPILLLFSQNFRDFYLVKKGPKVYNFSSSDVFPF